MIDESQTIVDEAVLTAPDPDVTAAPEVEVIEQPGSEEQPKTFTQEELDAIVAKARAKEERKWRRQMERQAVEAPVADVTDDDGQPVIDPAKIISNYEAQKQAEALQEKYAELEDVAVEKYDDFEQVAKNPTLPITFPMRDAIMASDIGPDVLYHLGNNPSEAKRISRLPDLLQAKEIGKIEATLAANPPTRKTSNAPAPINPVTAHNRGNPVYDTTDPRSTKVMSTSEWIQKDRERRWKEAQATR